MIAVGNMDVFITKLDSAGNFIQAFQMGGVSTDRGEDIFIDQDGTIYTCGAFTVSCRF